MQTNWPPKVYGALESLRDKTTTNSLFLLLRTLVGKLALVADYLRSPVNDPRVICILLTLFIKKMPGLIAPYLQINQLNLPCSKLPFFIKWRSKELYQVFTTYETTLLRMLNSTSLDSLLTVCPLFRLIH